MPYLCSQQVYTLFCRLQLRYNKGMENKKQCSTCRETYDATPEFFTRHSGHKDGLHNQCKKCHSKHSMAWAKAHPEYKRANLRKFYASVRRGVLEHYSGGVPHCACCGETEYVFLALDHINGGGRAHREELGGNTRNIMAYLKRDGYPEGYSVLCNNCNWGKHQCGECPHETKRREEKQSKEE